MRISRMMTLVLAVLALTFGLGRPATAAAADLNFTGTTLSGGTFNGASLQGKPAVLWFWTPWCPFCNQEAPSVAAVSAANPARPHASINRGGSMSPLSLPPAR